MIALSDWAIGLLSSGNLEEKLFTPKFSELIFDDGSKLFEDDFPNRPSSLKRSTKQIKFPSLSKMRVESEKGKAFHFFANHELLAIEMMAFVLAKFSFKSQKEKKLQKEILINLIEEQKHLKLYRQRMNELGIDFGDFPVNGYFWKYCQDFTSLSNFFAVMSLTFEAANLDFCRYFSHGFLEMQDEKSHQIMEQVYFDELGHVLTGLEHFLEEEASLEKAYTESLPYPLTPSRSKGIVFSELARQEAGFPADFIDFIKNYRDDFAITQRRQWKETPLTP